jgi:polyferredoxin
MGIDIRDGQQMACITCGLCIDACDDVMARIGRQRGLIDYFTLKDEELERAGGRAKDIWKHVFRPRTLVYATLWSLVGIGLVFALFIRTDIDVTVSPIRNPVYVTLSDGTIRNVYDLRLRNMSDGERQFQIGLSSDGILMLEVEGLNSNAVIVAPQEMAQLRVYVDAPPDQQAAHAGRTPIRFWIEDPTTGDRAFEDSHFNGKDE